MNKIRKLAKQRRAAILAECAQLSRKHDEIAAVALGQIIDERTFVQSGKQTATQALENVYEIACRAQLRVMQS